MRARDGLGPGLAIAILVIACGDDGDAAAGTTGPSGSTTEVAATEPIPSTTTEPMGDDGSSSGQVDETGEPPVMGECILWGADCAAESQKCMPWTLEENAGLPQETRCCALQDNPDLVGEACTVQDYDGSCLDSCEEGSMCVIDNPDTLSGVCRRFCDPSDLTDCPDTHTCKTFFELLPMVLHVPLCMDKCDPLLQDCVQGGWHCIPDSPTPAGQSGFICVPPPPDEPLMIFDACALANQCEAGLVCLPASRVPDCAGFSCCSAYCSLSEGDTVCSDLHPDMQCVDWMSPDPDWEDVGACAIPS